MQMAHFVQGRGKGESVTEIKHHKNNTKKVGGGKGGVAVAAVGQSGRRRQKNRHAEKLKQKLTCDKARHLAAI